MKLLSSSSSVLLHRRPSGAAGFLLCLLALSSAILESQSFRHGPSSSSSFSSMTRTTSPMVQRHIGGAHRRRGGRRGADSIPLMGATTAGLVAGAGAAAGLVAGARTAVVAATSGTSLGGAMGSMITCLRGGGGGGAAAAVLETTVGSAVAASLASGPYGVLGLAAIASAIVTPLTVYRQAYAFTVAYGLSAAAMGWALRTAFGIVGCGGPVGSLTAAMMAYGLRLSAHLLLRELTVPSKREQLASFDKTPRLKRIPFALSVGLFYGFMASPALFLCRASAAAGGLSGTAATAARIGGALAWFGLIVEAWTDGQKLWSKRGRDGAMDFRGPSTWWYGVSRHPNYAAEILFWCSVLAAGLPSFFVGGGLTPATGVGLVCSVLGVFGILQVMLGATKRLEGKQDEKYGGQLPFEEWKAKTGALAPPVSLEGLTGSILPGSISVGLTVLAVKLTSGV